jgi:hypothetical protein
MQGERDIGLPDNRYARELRFKIIRSNRLVVRSICVVSGLVSGVASYVTMQLALVARYAAGPDVTRTLEPSFPSTILSSFLIDE